MAYVIVIMSSSPSISRSSSNSIHTPESRAPRVPSSPPPLQRREQVYRSRLVEDKPRCQRRLFDDEEESLQTQNPSKIAQAATWLYKGFFFFLEKLFSPLLYFLR